MRSKVSVIGAGNVGATCAFRIAEMGMNSDQQKGPEHDHI